MTFSKSELVRYRIQRSKEVYRDGQILAQKESWNSSANRFYYACYYIISAYLVSKGVKSTTHSGLKSAFNLELIKSGKIDLSDGILFNKLFSIRQQVDYEDFAEITPEEIQPLIPKIEELINTIEKLIIIEDIE